MCIASLVYQSENRKGSTVFYILLLTLFTAHHSNPYLWEMTLLVVHIVANCSVPSGKQTAHSQGYVLLPQIL